MNRQTRRTFWQRVDRQVGFVHDERTEMIQMVGVRRAYYLAAVLLPLVAAGQQWIYGWQGMLGLMLTAVFLTLLALFLYRRRLLAHGTADERTTQLLHPAYRFAYLALLLTPILYATPLLFDGAGQLNQTIPGLFWWPPAILLTLLPLFATHIGQHSYPASLWRKVALAGAMLLLLAYLVGFWLGSR